MVHNKAITEVLVEVLTIVYLTCITNMNKICAFTSLWLLKEMLDVHRGIDAI